MPTAGSLGFMRSGTRAIARFRRELILFSVRGGTRPWGVVHLRSSCSEGCCFSRSRPSGGWLGSVQERGRGKDADEKVEAGDARRGRRIDAATVARGAIEGTVRDKVGAPVVAQVCGKAASDDLAAVEIGEPVCVTSGADGRYRLSGVLPASYSVGAAARGFIPATYCDANRRNRFDLGPGEERHGVDIVLQPGGVELAGVVKDVGGGPVEGALLKTQLAMGVALHAAVRMRSMADGRFRIGSRRTSSCSSRRPMGMRTAGVGRARPGRPSRFSSCPSRCCRGGWSTSGPACPCQARGWPAPEKGRRTSADLRGGGGRADDQGRFRLTRLPPGRYKPVATSPRGYGQARESVLLGLGQSVDGVVIEMHPAAMVTGRILVAGSEAPCSSGWVSLSDAKRERYFREDVGRDGRIRDRGSGGRPVPGHDHVHGFLAEEQYPDLVVSAGEPPAEQRWTARPAARIRGTVRTSEGAPLANASVSAHLHGAQGTRVSPNVGDAGTGADGRFEMTGLVSGTYAVSASAREHPQTFWPGLVTVGEAGEATVDIRLDVGGDLLGEVVDDKGHPVAGVGLNAESSAGDEDEALRSMLGIPAPTTADDGSFALRGLRPGTYRLSADRGPGFEARSLRSRGKRHADDGGERIEVAAGKTVRASFVVDSHSGVIRGRVVDGRGGPITDALVDAERESGPSGLGPRSGAVGQVGRPGRPIMTDSDGRFAIEKLAPGTYTLRAHRPGGGEALAEGVAVGADADLTIRPTGSIAGKVVSDGTVPDEMTIALVNRQTGFSRRERFFRTAGEFALRDLPPGKIRGSGPRDRWDRRRGGRAGRGTERDRARGTTGRARDRDRTGGLARRRQAAARLRDRRRAPRTRGPVHDDGSTDHPRNGSPARMGGSWSRRWPPDGCRCSRGRPTSTKTRATASFAGSSRSTAGARPTSAMSGWRRSGPGRARPAISVSI